MTLREEVLKNSGLLTEEIFEEGKIIDTVKSIPSVIKSIPALIKGREYVKDLSKLLKGLKRFEISEENLKKFLIDFCNWVATKPVNDRKMLIKDFSLFFYFTPLNITIDAYNKYYKKSDKHDFDGMLVEVRNNGVL